MSFGDFLGMAGAGMSILGGISGYGSSKDMEKAAKEQYKKLSGLAQEQFEINNTQIGREYIVNIYGVYEDTSKQMYDATKTVEKEMASVLMANPKTYSTAVESSSFVENATTELDTELQGALENINYSRWFAENELTNQYNFDLENNVNQYNRMTEDLGYNYQSVKYNSKAQGISSITQGITGLTNAYNLGSKWGWV